MTIPLAAICVALAVFAAGCGQARSDAGGKRVIVLGIDGMDPGFLERHWESLPNLDRLRRQGEFQNLRTAIPPQSPVAWSTFITGMDPGGHGIFDFIHRDPLTLMPFSSMAETEPPSRTLNIGPYVIPLSQGKVKMFRRGEAFWQVLDRHGIPVTVIRMPNNFPPVECKGRTLAGMGVPDLRGTFGTFTYFTDEAEEWTREVPGGRIVRMDPPGDQFSLELEGPANTLRRDSPRSSVVLKVDRDPEQPVARFETGGHQWILKQGEWSDWIRVEFPLIRGLQSASGMFRVYAKELRPRFRLYVSPVNLDPADPELPISTPPSYSRELAQAIGPFYTQGMAEDTAALREGVLTRAEYRQQSLMVSREHLRLLDYELDGFREGLLFFHFFAIDQDSHMLWGDHDEELLETYKLVDQAVGRVAERMGDSTLVVMSDHGFSRFDRAVHLNTWLWREGFLELDDPDKAGDEELFVHVDWSRTQAYSLGLNAIYLNLEGRERRGVVFAGEEAQLVKDEIKRRLVEFRDPANGERVIEAVYDAREVYRGPAIESGPDLVVGWAAGYRSSWQTALGAVPENLIEDNREEWRGDHCIAAHLVPGVLFSNRPSRLSDPGLEDLTVTLLAEFEIAPAEGMTGRRIF